MVMHAPNIRLGFANRLVVTVVSLSVAGFICGLLVIILIIKHTNPLPGTVRETADFPLFYPADLPASYKVDRTTINGSERLVQLVIVTPTKGKIVVSEQSKPSQFDFSSLKGDRSFITPYGK